MEARRRRWVTELESLSGSFLNDSTRITEKLQNEIAADGINALLDHLHICGAVPEQYSPSSSAEKLYAKYTDAVVNESFKAIGLKSMIISTRADVADVQARGETFSLVADAKAFRLSRTAKNQKDFKVEAMSAWRGDLDYAMVVAPIYQLPGSSSQIYRQATSSNVCILSYSHLAALVQLAAEATLVGAERVLLDMLRTVSIIHPAKEASNYWSPINNILVNALGPSVAIWTNAKTASLAGIQVAKAEAISYLQNERDKILALSHEEALQILLQATRLDARIKQIEKFNGGGLTLLEL